MNKTINYWLKAPIVLLGLCLCMSACSGDDDGDEITPSKIENYLYGKLWFVKRWSTDLNEKTYYSFFRNHLVMQNNDFGKITSGMLTYDDVRYFGTWQVSGDKIITTFTSGTYSDTDWNNILYGTLTVTSLAGNVDEITCTDPQGETRYLVHYAQDIYKQRTFTDYTDASDHDHALQGTWHLIAYKNNQPVNFTMTVGKNGKTHFTAESEDIDFTTTCTTKNGHVTFENYLVPTSGKHSYIYVRTDDAIELISETNAVKFWGWTK